MSHKHYFFVFFFPTLLNKTSRDKNKINKNIAFRP